MVNLKHKKLKILFRTAGGRANGTELGTGHLFRCINLGQNLPKHDIHFLINNYSSAKNLIKSNGFQQISVLNNNSSLQYDIDQTKKYVIKNKIDLVIVDKFKTTIKYLRAINKITKVIFISDIWKIDYPVDLVVNGFIGYKNSIRKNKFGSKCLLGPNYQILNKKFYKPIHKKQKQFDVLVTFGGYDEHNIVKNFCESFVKIKSNLRARIILGPSTKLTKNLTKFQKDYPEKLSITKTTNSMYDEISNAKFGLCAGGLTSYEFASFNLPFAIICQHKHQLETSRMWEKKKFAKNFGLPKKSTSNQIYDFIVSDNFKKLPSKSRIMDEKGIKRIEQEILKMFNF